MASRNLTFGFIGQDVSLSKTAHSIGGSMEDLGAKIDGPLGAALSKLGSSFDAIGGHGKNVLATLTGVGAGVAGLGGVLTAAHDKEKHAQQQLAAAVDATGKPFDDLQGHINKAVKANEKYGYTSEQTQDALTKLTFATQDPAAAFQNLSLTLDYAAAKHLDLATASTQMGKILAGAGAKYLKPFGITVASSTDAVKAATTAQKTYQTVVAAAGKAHDAYETALAKVTKAQQDLTDRQSIFAAQNKAQAPSAVTAVKQQQALRDATDKVRRAETDAASAKGKLTAANDLATRASKNLASANADAAAQGKNNKGQVAALTTAVAGQKDAVNTGLIPALKAVKAHIQDFVSNEVGQYGPAISAVGGGVATLATILDSSMGQALVSNATKAKNWVKELVLGKTALAEQTVATEAATVAQSEFDVAMDANPIGIVILALAALGAGLVILWEKSETFRKIVKGAFDGVVESAKWLWEKGIRPYFKYVADLWLTVVGTLVDGAAHAFGWVPGIGGKLKKAAKEFDSFKDGVNNALGGIHKHVDISLDAAEAIYLKSDSAKAIAKMDAATQRNQDGLAPHRAGGGPVLAGRAYVVGERRAELFIPSQSGRIEPSLAGVRRGGDTYFAVTVNGWVGNDRELAQKIQTGLLERQRTTGSSLGFK